MAVIARFCYRHKYLVALIWIVSVAGIFVAESVAGSAYSNNFSLPGTESTKALSMLQKSTPAQAGDSDTIVWQVTGATVRDPATQQRVTAMLEKVAKAPSVTSVTSPYTDRGATQISRDGKTAYAAVNFAGLGDEIPTADVQNVIDLAESASGDGLRVELGGSAIQRVNQVSLASTELIGVGAAAVVLLFAFGSLLAMLLPLVVALLSLAAAELSIALLSHTVSINSIAPTIAALVGLGVGIDYALFIVTRHRNGLKAGLSVEDSAVRALNTAGRAVIFAGATVCAAMLGLLVLRMSFLGGIGISAAVMVLFTVAAATTLLPALLGMLGARVLSRRERRSLATDGPQDVDTRGLWARWAAVVQRRPSLLGSLALAVMLLIALPVFSLRLGSSDQGNDPAGTTTRNAYDLLAQGFGPGFNGPLLLVAQIPNAADQRALTELIDSVRQTPGVAAALAAPAQPGATIAVVEVIPTTSPQDAKTSELIDRLRDTVIPAAERGSSLRVYVGGQTAIFDDFAGVLTGKLPLFIGVIIGLGFILMMMAFRSLLVPLTSAAMNLLAAASSFGVVVAFFQWGWGSDALGLGRPGPIEAFLPVMMLAILFGLSMDYQVFLVSRMQEEWLRSGDNRRAVTLGQASTGRVITAAATIMICVFVAFVFGGQRVIAEFGIGLASAVLLDALIVRTVLVPALMHLFGKANWWLPSRIDRWLPSLSVEPRSEPAQALPDEPVTVTAH